VVPRPFPFLHHMFGGAVHGPGKSGAKEGPAPPADFPENEPDLLHCWARKIPGRKLFASTPRWFRRNRTEDLEWLPCSSRLGKKEPLPTEEFCRESSLKTPVTTG